MVLLKKSALCCFAAFATLLLGACNVSNRVPSHPDNEIAKVASTPEADIIATKHTFPSPAAVRPLRQQSHLRKQLFGAMENTSFRADSMPATNVYSSVDEQYAVLESNKTQQTSFNPVSTFSIDVDTGAYSNMRRFLQQGMLPPSDAVRIEELLNYFSYPYSNEATSDQPFSVMTELGPTPWNANTQLLHIGLKGFTPNDSFDRASNLVFLIDVSGSMNSPNKLGLLKSSISMMARELKKTDTISIVVYAGSSGIVLEPSTGDQKNVINRALSRLQAGGSTNGAEGIELAYQLASDNYKEGGVNRVILATDGDFNVGISNTKALKKLIQQKRESGIALTTLGFGTGNYNDELMEQLADVGNGSYAYIDTLGEARKVLVDELQSTLLTIARDVKIQVEFNPDTVSEYRLIGYTNRHLDNEDFNNDKVDAGDIGAGHTVTALYEIALRDGGGERHTERRYGIQTNPSHQNFNNELAQIRLRYKLPEDNNSHLIRQIVRNTTSPETPFETSDSFRFSASVAAFGQLLRGSNRINEFDYQSVRELAKSAVGGDDFGYRAEFIKLVDMADSLDRIRRASLDHRPTDEG